MDMLIIAAETDARIAALDVLLGLMTPEEVGDLWLRTADRSHEAGQAFLNAYDAAGGLR